MKHTTTIGSLTTDLAPSAAIATTRRGTAVRSNLNCVRSRAAIADLADDFADLARLVANRMATVRQLEAAVNRPGSGVPPWVRDEVSAGVSRLLAVDADTSVEIAGWVRRARSSPSVGPVARLTKARRRIAEVIRARQALAAGLLVAADWHSPSIAHSVHSTAGRYDGRVVAHQDDYKRDRHPDEAVWERRWVDEMVDNPGGHPLRALMAASGMAAFTTVLAYVAEQAGSGPILMGASTYHECRELLCTSSLAQRVVAIPEDDLGAWRVAISRSPAAVFIDSQCNAPGLAVADVRSLIYHLADCRRKILLVVDNTARSVSMQPFAWLPNPTRLHLLLIESLTKYAQLGLDRAAGGVIVAHCDDARRLDVLREHLGTNIADIVLHEHPIPDRALLERRLSRIGRNAQVIANKLAGRITGRTFPVQLSYPGLGSHPGFATLADSEFKGGLVSIEPLDAEVGVSMVRRFIKAALHLGAERGVPICEGTSFGFDTTRMYLTSTTFRHSKPFLRIAAGTEHRLAIDAVADVLADALEMTA